MKVVPEISERNKTPLEEGRCPDHGIRMTQISRTYHEDSGQIQTIFACPHRNCSIRARAETFRGPWILMAD